MMELLPATLHGVRNRALLLLGFSGAFRRSELTGLEIADLSFNRDGITVQLRRSKTDQEGSGRQVAIPYGTNGSTCPVRAVQDWIAGGGIVSGPLFRAVDRHGRVQQERLSDQSVANIVKQSVRAIASARGMDFAAADEFSSRFAGHSLRAGLATSAAMAGATESSIMRQTGHRRADTVRKYIRLGTLFTDNAAARVGL
jgi:integrase